LYIEQKKNPHLHTPEVRMVILNNTGLSMTDLITERSIKALGTTKPWSMNIMGIRMFTAMWNFRAGLQNFLEALKTWKTKNGYNEAKIKNIT
jgi:hypothetical protein